MFKQVLIVIIAFVVFVLLVIPVEAQSEQPPVIQHGDIDSVVDAASAILSEIAAGSVLPLLLGIVLGVGIIVTMLKLLRWL